MIPHPPENRFLGGTNALIVGVLTCAVLAGLASTLASAQEQGATKLFARDNLIAWCIVPFDSKKRGPEERAAMLQRLGFKHFAYDWRAEHIPTFDAEVEALKRHGVALDAFWVAPGELNRESRIILDVLKRHGDQGPALGPARLRCRPRRRAPSRSGGSPRRWRSCSPLADEAAKIGCTLALYNHGGWFGEPENQLAIIERLKAQGVKNVGMVYNLHHGHDHLDRFPALLQADEAASRGPQPQRHGPRRRQGRPEDPAPGPGRARPGLAEDHPRQRLPAARSASSATPRTTPRSGCATTSTAWTGCCPSSRASRPARRRSPALRSRPAPSAQGQPLIPPEARDVAALVAEARKEGDSRRGAEVFLNPRFSCSSCHKVGAEGGIVGPGADDRGRLPLARGDRRVVALAEAEDQGGLRGDRRRHRRRQARPGLSSRAETRREIVVREATTGANVRIAEAAIEESRVDRAR